MKRKKKSDEQQKPESVKSERKRSMVKVPSAMDLDIEEADKGDVADNGDWGRGGRGCNDERGR